MSLENETNADSLKKGAIFEKRKWVGITSNCNNKCMFCLDGEIKNKFHKSISQIKKEFESGLKEGCTRLILSGGDPTIHPDFIDIIKMGKTVGYKKIQIITNGRMFYYKKFLYMAIRAGLNEITFSIHGHTSELHDSLTTAKGSFKQTIIGLKNALESNLIVSVDIVVNKKNVEYFPDIMKFLLDIGVREFDILQIMPFGNAIRNKESLFYNIENNLEYINNGFELAKNTGAVLWTNRFPPKYLEGNEDLIQDPYKMFDEVNGRKENFKHALSTNTSLKCSGERCPLCPLDEFCKMVSSKNHLLKFGRKNIRLKKKDIVESLDTIKKLYNYDVTVVSNKNMSNMEISELNDLFGIEVKTELKIDITKQNYDSLLNKEVDKCIFSFAQPSLDYQNYESIAPKIGKIIPSLYAAIKKVQNPLIKNIPYCFLDSAHRKLVQNDEEGVIKAKYLDKDSNIDIVKLTKDYIENKKVKSIRCKNCIFNSKCNGIFQKYIMLYGFKEINPIIK